ncbi:MAG: hypothetical protein GF346_13470 [Candidatus Eisenbacteria bacterium]|nr:hypothetical protein [Candidatus Latescibacterota bacterium]MBD3303450.1 hypothetical protein [Candidatus Eisenbacteria bacterium]
MVDQSGQTRETTLRDFTAIVFRRKGILLTVVLAALATVLFLNLTSEPSYLSRASLMISRGEPESVYNTRTKMLSWEEELNSEIEVLQSHALGLRVQRILDENGATNAMGEPIAFNHARVDATTRGKSSALVVTYSATEPGVAREALRALTRAYIEWREEQRSLPYVDRFFQEELDALRERLSEWEQRRADFMIEEGIVDVESERESMLRQREAAGQQLTSARARLADFAARLDVVEGLQEEKALDANVQIFGLGDAEYDDEELLFNLRKELVVRRSEYFDNLARYTEDHPEVLAAKKLVEHLEAQMDIELDNYVRFLEARITVTQARIASLEATFRAIDEFLYGLPDKAARLGQYDRIVDALNTDYTTMVERHIQAKVETTGRNERRVILLMPATPAEPQRTRDYVRLALVPLFGLLIGLALAFVFDGLDHSIKDATDAEENLRTPVLGSISRKR